MEYEFWLKQLRRYEHVKISAARPDRIQGCIDALVEEGRAKGWM